MNFPGVIAGDPEMLARVAAAGTRRVDGHSPGVRGRALDAYLAAGVESDHESTELEEAAEKRRKGMWVFIRQGSASQNLEALAPDIVRHGPELAAFCTDDREPDTLRAAGTSTTARGSRSPPGCRRSTRCCSPARTRPATTASPTSGSLGPGHQADVLCFDELGTWQPARVWQAGRLVAAGGRTLDGVVPAAPVPALMRGTMNVGAPPAPASLVLDHPAGTRVLAVGVESRSLTTRRRELTFGADGSTSPMPRSSSATTRPAASGAAT